MPRKVVAKTLRETPEMRARRLEILEELSVPLSEPVVLSAEEAKQERKREKKRSRWEAAAAKCWAEASPEWRAAERERRGIESLSDEDAATFFAIVVAFEKETARDEAKALRAPAGAAPRPVVVAAEEAPALEPRSKRGRSSTAARYLADRRLWD